MSETPSVDPHRTLRALLAPYAAGAFLVSVALSTLPRPSLGEVFALWSFAGLLFGGLAALLASAVVWRVDRMALRAADPGRWLLLAVLLAAAVHWAPMTLALPIAIYQVVEGDEPLRKVFLAMNPVWICAAAALAAWWVEGPLRGRQAEAGFTSRALARWWRGLPVPWLLAGVYGVAVAMPAIAWLAWAGTTGWQRYVEGMAIVTWSLLGVGAAAGMAGAFGPLQQRLAPSASGFAQRLHLAGLVLVVHWMVWFAVGLSPEAFADRDAQYSVLWAAFAWIVLGTGVASAGAAGSQAALRAGMRLGAGRPPG